MTPPTFFRAPFPPLRPLALAAALLLPPGAAAQTADDEPAGDYVAYACPIAGQEGAVVLGDRGTFHAACLALSRPQEPGPWTAADVERVDGSSRFCPRPVLTVLDRSGAITIRFLDAEDGSFLADPALCCHADAIAVDPETGLVRIATDGPARDCFGGTANAGYEDLYRWDGSELMFLESRQDQPGPAE